MIRSMSYDLVTREPVSIHCLKRRCWSPKFKTISAKLSVVFQLCFFRFVDSKDTDAGVDIMESGTESGRRFDRCNRHQVRSDELWSDIHGPFKLHQTQNCLLHS